MGSKNKRKFVEFRYSSFDPSIGGEIPVPEQPSQRTRGAAAEYELRQMYPHYGFIKPDTEIVSILKDHRDEYRSSRDEPFGSDKGLTKVLPKQRGGRHVGVYSFRRFARDDLVDFSGPFGSVVTTDAATYADIHSPGDSALFILLLEDEKIFFRLAEDFFYLRFPCVIIATPPGRPTDLATRLFLKRVHNHLKLPVLAFGCLNRWLPSFPVYMEGLSTDGADLGIRDIKWMGMTPLDVSSFSGTIPDEYKSFVYSDPSSTTEVLRKYSRFSRMGRYTHQPFDPRGMTYFCLIKVYLPLKLQQKDWDGYQASGSEDSSHLFIITGPLALEIWKKFIHIPNILWCIPNAVNSLLRCWKAFRWKNKNQKQLWNLNPHTVIMTYYAFGGGGHTHNLDVPNLDVFISFLAINVS